MTYLWALALTVGIEVPLLMAAVWLLRTPDEPHLGWAGVVGLSANLFTHGTLWTVFPLVALPYAWAVAACEAGVVLAEAAAFAGLGVLRPRDALIVSLALNGLTTGIGLVLG